MKLLLSLLFYCFPLGASEVKHFDAGKAFVSQHQASQPEDTQNIPGYQGTNIPETGLSHRNIQDALQKKINEKDNAGSFINETHDQRLRFNIDPSTDPVFTESDRIVANPMDTLRVKATETDEPVTEIKTRHICEEGGEDYTLTCTKDLIVTVTQTPSRATSFGFSLTKLWNHHKEFWHKYFKRGQGRHPDGSLDFGGDNKGSDSGYAKHYTYVPNPAVDRQFFSDLFALTGCIDESDPRCRSQFTENIDKLKIKRVISLPGMGSVSYSGQHFWLYSFARIDLDIIQPPVITQSWQSGCEGIEQKVDQGLCFYREKHCTQGKQTRIINGEPVTRDCWQETYTYQCSHPVKSPCDALKAKGCVQVDSQCKYKIANTCVHYAQTYECTERQGGGKKTKIEGDAPWCLDGNCTEQGFAASRDMAEALGKLMLFKEIQKDMDVKGPTVFRGDEYGCNRNCVDFKDCCGSGNGWGVSLGLAGCSEKEKALAQLRQDRKCVFVGTYCAEKALGVCLRKKTNYCCFGTKLARVIHEQGRPQLGMNFGDAERPQCRGFTVEELTKLDFDKIDLSELLSDLHTKLKTPNISKLSQDFSQDWKNRIPDMEKDGQRYTEKLREEAARKGEGHEVVF